ncbi:MAG: hypothetical protein K2K63_02045, partial [Acetatifactor sp.]|nr:hypothetical protein [Acetatifactor sp.]
FFHYNLGIVDAQESRWVGVLYKSQQYAQDAVDKTPYMAPDGTIAYKESIVKKLPQPPKRRERM